jgi:hypothetical protein
MRSGDIRNANFDDVRCNACLLGAGTQHRRIGNDHDAAGQIFMRETQAELGTNAGGFACSDN